MADLYSDLDFVRDPGYSNMSTEDVRRFIEAERRRLDELNRPTQPIQVPVAGGSLSPDLAIQQAGLEEAQRAANATAPRPRADVSSLLMPLNLTGMKRADAEQAINLQNQSEAALTAQSPAQNQELQKRVGQASYLGPLLGKPAAEDLSGNVLKALGIKPMAERELAIKEAKAKGGVGGKSALPAKLVESLGTPNYDKEVASAIASGDLKDPRIQISLDTAHDRKLREATLTDPESRTLISLRGSTAALKRLEAAYDNTPAAKSGKVSDTLKLALGKLSSGAALTELSDVLPKLTSEERRFIAEYNTFGVHLRRVSEDSRFSNFDSQKILDAVGNPIVGRKLFKDQLATFSDEISSRANAYEGALKGRRKDLSAFERPAESRGAPVAGTVVDGYTFKGGDLSKKENWSK